MEGADRFDKFVFPEPHGEIVTNNILDIDGPLRAISPPACARSDALYQPVALLAEIA